MAAGKPTVIWSADSRADLDSIWTYYERVAGTHTAEKVVRQIDDAVRLIDEHPLVGRARDEVHVGLRSLAATPHVVFYRVTDGVPEIVRVLDGRRDIDEIFSSSENS